MKYKAGLDPGLKVLAAVFVRDERDKTKSETFRYTSKTFHKDAGYDVIKRKRDKLIGVIERNQAVTRDMLMGMVGPEELDVELVNLEALEFREKVDVHMTTATARLRRRKKIRTRMALDKFASKLAPNKGLKKGRLEMFYGSGFGVGLGMRGQVSILVNCLHF